MKHLFLDTNIFLHFKSYDDIQWKNIAGDSAYAINIPLIVVTELDKKKNDGNNKIAKKAKSILKKFNEVIDNPGKGTIPINFISIIPNDSTFENNNLSKNHQDDSLIASILDFSIEQGDEKILITDDTALKLRSMPFDFKCINMPEEFRLEPELDETEKENKVLKQELNELKNKQPKVSLGFSNGTNQLTIIPKEIAQKEEYIKRESLKNKMHNRHLQKRSEITNPTLRAFGGMGGFMQISDSQIDTYNKELEEFYIKYEEYLSEEYEYKDYLKSCFEIELSLNNGGTTPAEDIDVHLHFPDGFELVDELKEAPEAPEPPYKPRNAFDFGHHEPMKFLHNINTPSHQRTYTGPRLVRIEKTNSYDVEIKLERLKHNQSKPLNKLYVCFDNIELMHSFHIDYTLMIGNLPKKIENKLHVIIDK